MQSSLIGKIEKAKRYAEEQERITFSEMSVNFHGEHNDYNGLQSHHGVTENTGKYAA